MAEAVHGRGKNLGPAACPALAVGNLAGLGVLPGAVGDSACGLLAILSRIVVGACAVCLGLTFARGPATLVPRAQS